MSLCVGTTTTALIHLCIHNVVSLWFYLCVIIITISVSFIRVTCVVRVDVSLVLNSIQKTIHSKSGLSMRRIFRHIHKLYIYIPFPAVRSLETEIRNWYTLSASQIRKINSRHRDTANGWESKTKCTRADERCHFYSWLVASLIFIFGKSTSCPQFEH